ncbi:uncharacterized protein LOC131693644 [Topomyia yanbarensis]|uniref:uncharacterized protein LOC131693644 n=1 Tax=Topomyia yanbarensis TaxID=2498891 RepID=UPI00273BB3BF|nr:uncharacterized protein LOC131693644 [Topomyia yanbarensis]
MMEEINLQAPTNSAASIEQANVQPKRNRIRTMASRLQKCITKKSRGRQDLEALRNDLNKLQQSTKVEKYEEFELQEMSSSPKISAPVEIPKPAPNTDVLIHPGSGKPISSPIGIPNAIVEYEFDMMTPTEFHTDGEIMCCDRFDTDEIVISKDQEITTINIVDKPNEEESTQEDELPPPIPEKEHKLPRVVFVHPKAEVQDQPAEMITVDKLFSGDQVNKAILRQLGQLVPDDEPCPLCLQDLSWMFHQPNRSRWNAQRPH